MKNATAMSHGSNRLLEAASESCEEGSSIVLGGVTFVGLGCIGLRDRVPWAGSRKSNYRRFRKTEKYGRIWEDCDSATERRPHAPYARVFTHS
jgi:hypothetical protein